MKIARWSFLLSVFLPSLAQAEWSYDVNGSATGLYGYSDLEKRFEDQNHHSQGTGDFTLSNALTYSDDNEEYSVSFNVDVMAGIDHNIKNYNQGSWGEEVYAIVDSSIGRVMIGQTTNVAEQFHLGAPSFGALGLNNSRLTDFIANPNWRRDDKTTYFATLNSTAINTDGTAPKISIITPEFYQTLLGFTYVPDSYSRSGLVNKFAHYQDKDGFIASIYHNHEIFSSDLNLSLSYGEYHDQDKEFALGFQLSRGGWTLGASGRKTYCDGTDKRRIENSLRTPEGFDDYREGFAWDVGVGYEIGPYRANLGYFEAKADGENSQSQMVMLENNFQLDKNLDVYLSGAYASFAGKTKERHDNRRGFALVSGVRWSF